jgi:hypothetical protein
MTEAKIRFNFAVLQRECNSPGITQKNLQKRYTAGSRLIYLASASKFESVSIGWCLPFEPGSLYILGVFAACGMKNDICFKHTGKQIQVLAFTLCNPAGECCA